jgi:hypothetical protein
MAWRDGWMEGGMDGWMIKIRLIVTMVIMSQDNNAKMF